MKNQKNVIKEKINGIKKDKNLPFNSFLKRNKGITLVALVVTIIVLIILAGVSITLILSDNGIFNKAASAQETQDIASISEKLELLKGPILLDKHEVTLEDYLEKYDEFKEQYNVTWTDKVDQFNAYTLLENKYKYLLTETENKDVQIIYQGEVGDLLLSEYSGSLSYPETLTFTVTRNASEGALSVSSKNENIAKATIEGNTVTVQSGTVAGTTQIIVKSAATDAYAENRVIFTITVSNGEIEVIATEYGGIYDGSAHGIIVTAIPTDSKIEYSKNGVTYQDTNPKYTTVGEYTTYYKVSKPGYITVTGAKTITITKVQSGTSGLLQLEETEGTYTYPTSGTVKITKNESGGTLSVTSSDDSVATATIDNNILTVVPGTTEGTAALTIKSSETENYEEQSIIYMATVLNGIINVEATPVDMVHDGNLHGITVKVNSPEGTTITYSSDGKTYNSKNPTYKDVGTYTTYYKIEKPGYTTVTGSQLIKLSHNYSTSFTVNKEATCTESGSKSKHCTVSGCTATTEVTTITALGHNSVNGGTEAIHTKCSRCGVTLSSTHNYSQSIVTAATCTAKGTSKYTCSCGYSYTSQDIAALGHNSVNGGTSAIHTKCSRCGVTLSSTHSYTKSVVKAPTCTAGGTNKFTCNCGYYYTQNVGANGHTYHITGYTAVNQSNWNEAGVHSSKENSSAELSLCSYKTVRIYSSATSYVSKSIPWEYEVIGWCVETDRANSGDWLRLVVFF